MAYGSMKAFVDRLEAAGELVRIGVAVDPILEITEIADRVVKAGGPALLFENVVGSPHTLLINAYGSERRMAWALGFEDLSEVTLDIEGLLEMEVPEGWIDKLKLLPKLAKLAAYAPETVSSGPCQEVVEEEPSLVGLPIMQCWPEDAGRYITLPQVITRSPHDGKRNVGMYRMQVLDEKSTAMHWQLHHDANRHYHEATQMGLDKMEVAISLGGDPALTYSATAPLPPGMDEYLFAGYFRKEKVRMVKCKTVDLEVPASSDFVLEGYVKVGETVTEGPFGDHTGFYTGREQYPVFRLTAITRRREPIYPSTMVGKPIMEDAYLGLATIRLFLPFMKVQIPELVDFHMPPEACFHNLAIVSIEKRYPYQARKVMHQLWGLGQMMLTKCIVVVDSHIDVRNPTEALWYVAGNIDARRDILFTDGPVDVLDHASPILGVGSKMGIDGTRKLPEEGHPRPWPEELRMNEDIIERVKARWEEYGLAEHVPLD
jgi:4-hydroxy-3-polyprenylbenzoate decarboxylase